ncbi:MAG: DUF192 domain-containing protein [Gemmatimonadetes bacterium]|nr:DUF192 domain-containing protein [Gemmatimonadota bacterium]
MDVRNETRQADLGSRVLWANHILARLRGFLMRPEPARGEGILFSPCKGVHMYGMKFALDVLFLDREGRVVSVFPDLAPGERTPLQKRAYHALELPTGTIRSSGTQVGDLIAWSR